MDLLQFTLVTVSIAASLFSLVLIVGLIITFDVYRRLGRILDRIETITEQGAVISETVHQFVGSATNDLQQFIASLVGLKWLKEVAMEVVSVVKANRHPVPKPKKEEPNVK